MSATDVARNPSRPNRAIAASRMVRRVCSPLDGGPTVDIAETLAFGGLRELRNSSTVSGAPPPRRDRSPPMPQTSAADRKVPTRRISFDESLADLPKHFAADGDLVLSHLAASLSSVFPDGEDFF